MSYLSDEILRQMESKRLTGAQLATTSGYSAAQISKWTRGEQSSVNADQLSALQSALSDDPHDHARLVLAHLLDEKFGLHHEMVEIAINSYELNDAPRPRSKGEAAVAFLAKERVHNRELNELLIDLARLLGPKIER